MATAPRAVASCAVGLVPSASTAVLPATCSGRLPAGRAVTPRPCPHGLPPATPSCRRRLPVPYAATSGLLPRSGTSHVATPSFKGDVILRDNPVHLLESSRVL